MTNKRNLKKSTRIDEENKKTELLEFFIFYLQIVRDFTDLSGTV